MTSFTLPTWRSLAAAGASAVLVAGIGLVSSSAAEPPAGAPGGAAHQHEATPMEHHLQAHLDRLAERLEIKASQEDVWQKFAASARDAMADEAWAEHGHGHDGHEGHDGHDGNGAPADAATLARRHAEHAQRHAQHLAQLADATAALEANLNPNQRQVLDEVARHLASGHGPHGWEGGGHGEGYGPEHGYHHGDDGEHERGEHGWNPHGDDAPPRGAPQ